MSQGLNSFIFHTASHFCLEGTPFSVPPNTVVLKVPTATSIWKPVGSQNCLYTAPMHYRMFRDNSQCLFCVVLKAGLTLEGSSLAVQDTTPAVMNTSFKCKHISDIIFEGRSISVAVKSTDHSKEVSEVITVTFTHTTEELWTRRVTICFLSYSHMIQMSDHQDLGWNFQWKFLSCKNGT